MTHLLIYTPEVTNRINYIFKFIFQDILKVNYRLTSNISDFQSYQHAKISYADKPLDNELFFKSGVLLTEKNIQKQPENSIHFDHYQILYPVENSCFPFDVFATAFYLLSRYEEYLPSTVDEHRRFQAEESFSFKNAFLNRPVIDEWAYQIKEKLISRFPTLQFKERGYHFLPTIDIDRAFAYKSSGILKNTARFGLAVLNRNISKARSIINVGTGKEQDPFDTYRLMDHLHKQAAAKPVFFFLLGDPGKHDVNLHFEDKHLGKLINRIADYASIGIHPSYRSNEQPKLIKMEKHRLEKIINTPVSSSRQHYLRLHLPQTYQQLISAGLQQDYSMGYASQIGFRAGTCTSFNWYDLSADEETKLLVHPFAAMDTTLQQYMRLSTDEALHQLKELCNNVRKVKGCFTTLWHNESLSDTGKWKGWRKVYQELVNYSK